MTQNQIQYWANQETARANRERERQTDYINRESARHNVAVENENQRHNYATETQARADLSERTRYNRSYLAETQRHSKRAEQLEAAKRDIERMQVAANVDYNSRMATVSMLNALTNRYLAQVQSDKADIDRFVSRTGRLLADVQRERNRNDYALGLLADERERQRLGLDSQRLSFDTSLGWAKLQEQDTYHSRQIGVDLARIGIDGLKNAAMLGGLSGVTGMSSGPYYYGGAPMLAP